MLSRTTAFLLSFTALACSESDGSDDPPNDSNIPGGSCRIGVELAGGVNHALLSSEEAGCGSSFAGDTDVVTGFLPLDGGPVSSFTIQIDGIGAGEVGNFPGTVRIVLEDNREWISGGGCAFGVEEHEFEEIDENDISIYSLGATGTCEPASADGEEDVTITELAFRTNTYWF